MKSINQLIGSIHSDNAKEREHARRFWELCTAVFSDPAGQELMRMICHITDPMGSPMKGTPEETFCAIGRQEWIAALWRRSQPSIEPQDAPPTQYHASETTPAPESSPGHCTRTDNSNGTRTTTISADCDGCAICHPGGWRQEGADPA